MTIRSFLILVLGVLVLSACGSGSNSDRAVPAPPEVNDDGSVVTAVLTAVFNPSAADIPLPNNLTFSGTTDLTLNLTIDDPDSPFAPFFQAINALDGCGTTTPWFAAFDGSIDPTSVVPGQTVRWFEVQLAQPAGPVVAITRELVPGVDFVATVSTSDPARPTVLLVPLRPLQEITSYMAVITRGVRDAEGNNATPDQTYFIAQRTTPLVNESGQSTDPLLDDATARALEPVRQLTNAQEAAAAAAGIPRDEIVVTWVATTQSVTPVTAAAASLAGPQASQLAPTGITTAAAGGAGIADIYIGVMTLPYYLEAPSASNPAATYNSNWEAAPGAYVPPFDQLGLSPLSTNITLYNPFPVERSVQTVPVLVTVPNAASGQTPPASGWPAVIFGHPIGADRTTALAVADSMALAGQAVVAIDLPGHGIGSTKAPDGSVVGPEANPLYIENTPFGAVATERTFDVDIVNNLTGAPGPDGFIDETFQAGINFTAPLNIRDGLRQGTVDLVALAATVPFMDFSGDGFPDFDGSRISFVGVSLGSLSGIPFTAIDPTVQAATHSAPGGGLIGVALNSSLIGPPLLAGLAALGVTPGTPEFEQFVFAVQTAIDSADPINWAGLTAAVNQGILVQEIVGDTIVPDFVEGFPLSGSGPLIREMGLAPITASTQDPAGIRGVTRIREAGHFSLLDPSISLNATLEMQGQAASFSASNGRAVQVTFPNLLQGE